MLIIRYETTFFMFVASYINVFTYFVIRDIGYPFKAILLDVGRGIENVDMKDISPFTIVALTAMKYICAKAQ